VYYAGRLDRCTRQVNLTGGLNRCTTNSISTGALPQTPLGELTALPQTALLYLRGLLLTGGEGRDRERKGEGRGLEGPPFCVGIGPPEGLIRH